MYEIILSEIIPAKLISALSEDAVYLVVNNIAEGARAEWIRLAGKATHTSKADYLSSIQPVVYKPGLAVLSLVGQPANIIEHGSPAVDLRDWLLGPRVPVAAPGQPGKRKAKDGSFYRAVPFRHGIPTSTAQRVGRTMGDPYRKVVADSKALGRAVYKTAKNLGTGERLQANMAYGRGKNKSVVPKLKPHHKTDIYAGMTRVRAAYGKAIQSQYKTFRMISTRVGPSDSTDDKGKAIKVGWIRPATQGIHLAEKVGTYVVRTSLAAFQTYVKNLKP